MLQKKTRRRAPRHCGQNSPVDILQLHFNRLRANFEGSIHGVEGHCDRGIEQLWRVRRIGTQHAAPGTPKHGRKRPLAMKKRAAQRKTKTVGRPPEPFSPSATLPARCFRLVGEGAEGATLPAEGATLPLLRPECVPPPPPPISTPSPFPRRPRSTPDPTYLLQGGGRGAAKMMALRGVGGGKARTETWTS